MIEAVLWLALNIYFESRNEPLQGQIAVAEVTLNRVASPHYPDTVKEVVTQKGERVCSFSWYCDGKSDRPKEKKAWENSVFLAKIMLDEYTEKDRVTCVGETALFFHATSVSPYWLSDVSKIKQIGGHIFYERNK